MDEDDALTYRIIGCGMEVHRQLGPGLTEANYEEALCIELTTAGLSYLRQVSVPVLYKGQQIGEHRPDLVVENGVVVEIKSVERLIGVHLAQVLTYMRILRVPARPASELQQRSFRTGIQRLRMTSVPLCLGASMCRRQAQSDADSATREVTDDK